MRTITRTANCGRSGSGSWLRFEKHLPRRRFGVGGVYTSGPRDSRRCSVSTGVRFMPRQGSLCGTTSKLTGTASSSVDLLEKMRTFTAADHPGNSQRRVERKMGFSLGLRVKATRVHSNQFALSPLSHGSKIIRYAQGAE